MDIWGGDPWSDNGAKTPRIEKTEQRDLAPVQNGGLEGYEDEAGWGDFETSDEPVWGKEQVEEGVVLWGNNEKEDANHRTDSFALDSTAQETGADSFPEEEEDVALSFVSDNQHSDANEWSVDELKQDNIDEESSNSTSTVVAEVRDVEESQESRLSEDVTSQLDEPRREDPEVAIRPISSSSETTSTPDSSDAHSARTSIDQGIPDAQKSEKHELVVQHTPPTTLKEKPNTLDRTRESFDKPEETAHEEHRKIRAPPSGPDFVVDVGLVSKLFKIRDSPTKKQDSAEDLISSIATRKSWYRITRPQTLRGFQKGDTDDSYTRVAWPGSEIRKETIRIVSRWNSEDRINGGTVLGGAGNANFGWDQPVTKSTTIPTRRPSGSTSGHFPTSPKRPMHNARQSSVSFKAHSPATAAPIAQFNWSSSPIESPSGRAPENPWRKSMQSRPSSIQIPGSLDAVFSQFNAAETSGQSTKPQSRNSLETSNELAIEPLQTQESTLPPDNPSKKSKPDLSNINIALANKNPATADDLDDEDWGEMVQSPPPPDTPMVQQTPNLPTLGPIPINQDLHPKKVRTVSPIVLPAPNQPIPEGPLSPARKAAFNAARVTRSLSSQQTGEESSRTRTPPTTISAAQIKPVETVGISPIPSQSSSPKPPFRSIPELPTENQRQSFSDDDFSLFETLRTKQSPSPLGLGITNTLSTPATKPIPSLSEDDHQKVRRILAQLPDMSYMLR